MSSFSRGFNNGFLFGMLSNIPMFGCFNSFRNPFAGFTPFFPSFSIFPSFNNVSYPMQSGGMDSFMPILPSLPNLPSIFNASNYTEIPAFTQGWDTISLNQNDSTAFSNFPYTYQALNTWQTTPNYSNLGSVTYSSEKRTSNTNQNQAKKSESTTSHNSGSLRNRPKHWSLMTDEQMRQIYGNYDRDITKPYSGSAEDLNKFLNAKGGSILKNKGSVFIRAQRQYGINAMILIAICGQESSYGKNGKNNAYYNVGNVRNKQGGFKKYSNVDDAIMDLARMLKESYVDNPPEKKGAHLTKLYQINARYCPVGVDKNTPIWASGVERCCQSIEKFIA